MSLLLSIIALTTTLISLLSLIQKSKSLSKANIELTRQETLNSTLTSTIKKLEDELVRIKDRQAITQELLYQEKQNFELKKQEMRDFETRVSDWEKSRNEAITQAKAAIFETASILSKELLEQHKKESKESETKLSTTALKLQDQFEKIVNTVSVLNNEIKSSKESMENVKNALLSPSGAGNLAEITLENILKASGLHPNRDFVIQYSFSTSSQEKVLLRPDAVVFLPGDNLMIIDSKSSKFFVELTQEQDKDKVGAINDKIKSTMRQHLKGLRGKNYDIFLKEHFTHKTINHITSIMFLPSEAALEKLLLIDKDFMLNAWENDIFPVGPSGLVNLLIYAKFQISSHTQAENHALIVEEIQKLLNSVAQVYEHTKKLGSSLHSTTSHFDRLAGSLNSNFLSKARNLEKLGVTAYKKALPEPLDRLTVISSGKSNLIEVDTNEPQQIQQEDVKAN